MKNSKDLMATPKDISDYLLERFTNLGKNKIQESVRLIYEISKRDHADFRKIVDPLLEKSNRYIDIKRFLIKKRFPNLKENEILSKLALPEINIDPESTVDIKDKLAINPSNIYIEESVEGSDLSKRIKTKFLNSKHTIISSYRDHVEKKNFAILDFNKRVENFYITKENFDFYLNCPCSPKSVCCDYHTMKLVTGCAYECMYCYMQGYINSPGIVLPANIDDFFLMFEKYKQDVRIGSGQFTDSLIFDDITGYSPLIVEFFKNKPRTIFEFKTKSANVDLLLKVKPADNILVSWSLNPENIIEEVELYTASLDSRLEAALKCFNAGYRVGFHFDPIIFYNGWEGDYKKIVERIFSLIDHNRIAWISLGCLRMTPRLKQIIENRFPKNKILDEEFLLGFDNKLRYSFNTRLNIYTKMKQWVRSHSDQVPLYLCMESKDMCAKSTIFPDDKKMKLY